MKKYLSSAAVVFVVGCIIALAINIVPATADSSQTTNASVENSINEPQITGEDNPTALLAGINTSEVNITGLYSDEMTAQWGLNHLSIHNVWEITLGNPEIIVAVLDTGIDSTHPDLAGQVIKEVNFSSSPTSEDIYGHGTHIAGIIAAKLDNQGIAGIAPSSRLFNVKVAEDDGTCDIENVARGIEWAVDNGARIINISIQLSNTSRSLEKSIEYANDNGVIIVAAAGNNRFEQAVYPAYYPSTIAVTAITLENNLAPLANIADWVDYAVPGHKIYSTMPDGGYGYETGTSFAAAHMSGLVALLYSMVLDAGNGMDAVSQVHELLGYFSQDYSVYGYSINTLDLEVLNN